MKRKGYFLEACLTPECSATGGVVRGIPGQANMYQSGDAMNVSHRCRDCNDAIRKALETLLDLVAGMREITDAQASTDPQFIEAGKAILAMEKDELHSVKVKW